MSGHHKWGLLMVVAIPTAVVANVEVGRLAGCVSILIAVYALREVVEAYHVARTRYRSRP